MMNLTVISRRKLMSASSCLLLAVSLNGAYPESALAARRISDTPPLFSYSEFVIENGLRVVVVPNHSLPIVRHTVVYQVGGADEREAEHGVAHYLEHLMFQGTKRFPKGSYSRFIARHGGSFNATTYKDNTTYYAHIPKAALPRLMEIEADRMTNLHIRDSDVDRERSVVLEEYRQKIISAGFHYARQRDAAMYAGHPYRRAVIGRRDEILKLDGAKAMAFYKRHYGPGSAVLVLSGDVTEKEARALVANTFANVKTSNQTFQRTGSRIDPPKRQRVVVKHARASTSWIQRNYVLPRPSGMTLLDRAALYVFFSVVGDQTTGPLHTQLVRSAAVAATAGASFSPYRLATHVQFSVSAAPGISKEVLEAKFDEALEQILINGISESDFEEFRQNYIASKAYLADSQNEVVSAIIASIVFGFPPRNVLDLVDTIKSIKFSEVNRIAIAMLKRTPFITGQLQPQLKRDALSMTGTK